MNLLVISLEWCQFLNWQNRNLLRHSLTQQLVLYEYIIVYVMFMFI